MLKRLSYVSLALVIFILGCLVGSKFPATDHAQVITMAQAGDCGRVTYSGWTTATNYPGYTCGYLVRFDKTVGRINKCEDKAVCVYFK